MSRDLARLIQLKPILPFVETANRALYNFTITKTFCTREYYETWYSAP